MRLPRLAHALAATLPIFLALGCHSALDDALDSYADARYPTAAAQFRAIDPGAPRFDQRFASYSLYRGLTHLALGDARAAAHYLGYAKQCLDRDPSLFDEQQRGALIAAWRSMGRMPGEAGVTLDAGVTLHSGVTLDAVGTGAAGDSESAQLAHDSL